MSQSILSVPAAVTPARPRLFAPLAMLRLWWRRARTRVDLSEVPDHILRDIGATAAEARREATRPFWQG